MSELTQRGKLLKQFGLSLAQAGEMLKPVQDMPIYPDFDPFITPELDPFVDEWHADQLRAASFEFVRTFLDGSEFDYWYWEDTNVYPFENVPMLKLTAYRLGLLEDCNRENGISGWYWSRFKPESKRALTWLISQGLIVKREDGHAIVTPLGKQYLPIEGN